MSQSEREEYWHNKGQEDYADDKGYNEPYGGLFSTLGLNRDDQIDLNDAYRDGWKNAKKQDKD